MSEPDARIGATTKVARNPEVTYRDLEEGGVLLNVQSGAYHGLNSTGSAIWKLLNGEPTVSDVAAGLREQLDDAPEGLEQDVARFLDGLRQRNLVLVRQS